MIEQKYQLDHLKLSKEDVDMLYEYNVYEIMNDPKNSDCDLIDLITEIFFSKEVIQKLIEEDKNPSIKKRYSPQNPYSKENEIINKNRNKKEKLNFDN